MKKTILYFFAGLIVLTSANSCKDNSYPTETATLDSLMVVIELSESALVLTDTMKIKKAYEEIISDLKFIQSNLTDTVTREEALLLSDYRGIRKRLGKFSEHRSKLLTEAAITKKQLADLSKDLKKGLVPDNKAKEYYAVEYALAVKLNEDMEASTISINNALSIYDKLKPGVDQFIGKMNTGQ